MKRATGTSLGATSGGIRWDGDAPPYGARLTVEWHPEHKCPGPLNIMTHPEYVWHGDDGWWAQDMYGNKFRNPRCCPFCGEKLA